MPGFLRKALVDPLTAAFSTITEYLFYRKYPRLIAALGGQQTYTGRIVTEATALNNSTVWACVRVISETLASLPLNLIEQTPKGKFVAQSHPLQRLLHDEPNPEMSDFQFRETLTSHCLLWGNAFARIVRRSGTGEVIAIWPLLPTQVQIKRDDTGALQYIVRDQNGQETVYPQREIFHLAGLGMDGVIGYSVVSMARHTIALAQIQEEYAARFFASGGRKPYVLTKGTRFKNDQEYQQFREKWEAAYADSTNPHRAIVLEGDIEYKEIGMSLEDAQFLSSRQFSVPEICRWFRVSPHLVGDLSRATFSNIEHLAIEFVQHTLMAWIVRWEKAINRQLLSDIEKRRFFAKHNVGGLLRGDFESRFKGYSSGLQNGVYSINEVRDLEDLNPIPGGDGHRVQANLMPI